LTVVIETNPTKEGKRELKAAGDKLLMNTFIRQNFGEGLTLKNFIS